MCGARVLCPFRLPTLAVSRRIHCGGNLLTARHRNNSQRRGEGYEETRNESAPRGHRVDVVVAIQPTIMGVDRFGLIPPKRNAPSSHFVQALFLHTGPLPLIEFESLTSSTFPSVLPAVPADSGLTVGMGNMGRFFGRLFFFPPAKQKCVRGRGEYHIANWIAMDTNNKPARKN